MGKTPDEEYREALKRRLTEKKTSEAPVYYSRTGFRKKQKPEEPTRFTTTYRPRRRIGLVLMVPLLLLFMLAGNLRGVVIPLVVAVIMYFLIKRRR